MANHTERYGRELRRFTLALHMIAHNARTQTIRRWTGLSRPRVHETSRSYWSVHDTRSRIRNSGPPPSALKLFWQSRGMHREAATLAGLCGHFGVFPAEAAFDMRRLADLPRGERFCMAYETYLTFVSRPRISFEHAVLLLTALVKGTDISLSHCPACKALLLVDRQNAAKPRCTYCKP